MTRVTEKLERFERQIAKNKNDGSTSTRSTRTTGATLRPSSRERGRRSLSVGVGVDGSDRSRRSSRSTRSTDPQHALLLSPQRYLKSSALLSNTTSLIDDATELERLSAQQRAVDLYAYHSSDDSESEVTVLDLNSEDEASFDHNLPIERSRKPRRSKKPKMTGKFDNQASNDTLSVTAIRDGSNGEDRGKGSGSLILPPASPSERKPKKSSDKSSSSRSPRQRSKSSTRQPDVEQSPKKSNTKSNTKSKDTTEASSSPKLKKTKKIKAKSVEDALQSFLNASSTGSIDERQRAGSLTPTTPTRKLKDSTAKLFTPKFTSKKVLTPKSVTKTSAGTASTPKSTPTPKSASMRSRPRTTNVALPTIDLEASTTTTDTPTASPANKSGQKKKIVVIRRKKKKDEPDADPGSSESIQGRYQARPHDNPHVVEQLWDYFGSQPDISNSLEQNSSHTAAIYQAATAAQLTRPNFPKCALQRRTNEVPNLPQAPYDRETSLKKGAADDPPTSMHSDTAQPTAKATTSCSPLSTAMPSSLSEKPDRDPPTTASPIAHSSNLISSPNSTTRDNIKPHVSPLNPEGMRSRPVEECSLHQTAQIINSPSADVRSTPESSKTTNVKEELMHTGPDLDARHRAPTFHHIGTERSITTSPTNVVNDSQRFDRNESNFVSSKIGASPRGRPKSPPGFVASNFIGATSPSRRRKEVQSLDTNRFAFRLKEQQGKQENVVQSEESPRSQLAERQRSPITPRKIMDAFERLSDSKHSSPGRISTVQSTTLESTIQTGAFRPIKATTPSPNDVQNKLIIPQPSKLNTEPSQDADDGKSSALREIVDVKTETTAAHHGSRKPDCEIHPLDNQKDSKAASYHKSDPNPQLQSIKLLQPNVEDMTESKTGQTQDNDSTFTDHVTKMTRQNESIFEARKSPTLLIPRETKDSIPKSDDNHSNDPEKSHERGEHEVVKIVDTDKIVVQKSFSPGINDGGEGLEGYKETSKVEWPPESSNTDQTSPEKVVSERQEDDAYENLLYAIVQVQQNDESCEEITVESFPGPAYHRSRRTNRRPKSVAMVRMNSGISQVTIPDFVTDEEYKIERLLERSKREITSLKQLLVDKEAEVKMLLKRRDELRRDRLRCTEEYDSTAPTNNFDNEDQCFNNPHICEEESSFIKITTEAEKEWEEAKSRRLQFLASMIDKKKEEVRWLSAQEAEIQMLDAKAMEFELERKSAPDIAEIVFDQEQREIRQWANARAKRSSSIRQRLDDKTREIQHLTEQENEVRNLEAMAGDPGIDSISLKRGIRDLEAYTIDTAIQDEEMLWKKAKLRRLEMLLGSLDKKNEELIFLEKQRKELGLSFETQPTEDEVSDNWERKTIMRLESLYGHLERNREELQKLNDEDGVDFVSTQSLIDSTSAEKGDDDAWEQAKRLHLKVLHEHIERKNEELRLLEIESNGRDNDTPLPEDILVDDKNCSDTGKQWRDVRLQRRKILLQQLERKNEELALLRGQLQGVTRGQREVADQAVSTTKSNGLSMDALSYVSSADERASQMISMSNTTNLSTRAVAETRSIMMGSDEEEI